MEKAGFFSNTRDEQGRNDKNTLIFNLLEGTARRRRFFSNDILQIRRNFFSKYQLLFKFPRSMGGMLRMHVFTGPTAKDVSRQLANKVILLMYCLLFAQSKLMPQRVLKHKSVL